MTFRLVHTEYDKKTQRAYVEWPDGMNASISPPTMVEFGPTPPARGVGGTKSPGSDPGRVWLRLRYKRP